MELTDLSRTIEDDARREADAIDQSAREEVARISVETQRLVAERKRELEEVAKRKRAQELARLESKARRDARMRILAQKQEILDETFAMARDELAARKGAARSRLLDRLLKRARAEIEIGSIIAAKADKAALAKEAKVASVIESIGGFIAIDTQGKVRVDLRFERLLEDVRTHKSGEIAEILW